MREKRSTKPIARYFCGLYLDRYVVISTAYQLCIFVRIGWENMSWGYHGDDGHLFCCSGTGKPYGPQFTTGDVIGCCVNFRDGTAFYTKNGAILGVLLDHSFYSFVKIILSSIYFFHLF